MFTWHSVRKKTPLRWKKHKTTSLVRADSGGNKPPIHPKKKYRRDTMSEMRNRKRYLCFSLCQMEINQNPPWWTWWTYIHSWQVNVHQLKCMASGIIGFKHVYTISWPSSTFPSVLSSQSSRSWNGAAHDMPRHADMPTRSLRRAQIWFHFSLRQKSKNVANPTIDNKPPLVVPEMGDNLSSHWVYHGT